MFTKDLERLVRSLARQRLDPEYIRHYLSETYQLGEKQIDEVFKTVGVVKEKKKFNTKATGMQGGDVAKPKFGERTFK
jgi:hypothetical protein